MQTTISIQITAPPEGYSQAKWKPIYLPFGDNLILIGECWVRADTELKYGGGWHIWCSKLTDNQEIHPTEKRGRAFREEVKPMTAGKDRHITNH
jgi:hypothetical protein